MNGAGGGLWMHHVKPDNAKVYGAFIGKRFARFQNLMWMHAGDRNPDANLAECTRIPAREIQAAAPHHLQTVHNAHEFAWARLAHSKFEPDGSGVVSSDMSDVYAGVSPEERGRKSLYERYGGVRRPSAFLDRGITGQRSVAVDYSGKSGAPCLLAIADKIRSGKSKVWIWQLGQTAGKNPVNDLSRTKVEGNMFTITKGDATLRGTFILPSSVRLSAEVREKSLVGDAASVAGKVLERPIAGVFAEGADDFFVVVTMQRGAAPEVKLANAKAQVGARTVSFDGQTVVME